MAARGQSARARAQTTPGGRRRSTRLHGLLRLGALLVLLVVGGVAAWNVFGGGSSATPTTRAGASARSATAASESDYVLSVSEAAAKFKTPTTIGAVASASAKDPWRLGAAVLATVPTDSVVLKAGAAVNAVALTFDDGPSPYTASIVRTLARYDAHATFFMLGREVKAYPDMVAKVLAGGNAIGDHTWSHQNLETLTPLQRKQEREPFHMTIHAGSPFVAGFASSFASSHARYLATRVFARER